MSAKFRAAGIVFVFWVLCTAVPCPAQQTSFLTSASPGFTEDNSPSGQQATAKTPAAASTEDLQKAAQNPVASMISVPIQNNSNFGIGPYDRIQNVLNVQPVIPVQMKANWNLII